jgi:hypothetical protein
MYELFSSILDGSIFYFCSITVVYAYMQHHWISHILRNIYFFKLDMVGKPCLLGIAICFSYRRNGSQLPVGYWQWLDISNDRIEICFVCCRLANQ